MQGNTVVIFFLLIFGILFSCFVYLFEMGTSAVRSKTWKLETIRDWLAHDLQTFKIKWVLFKYRMINRLGKKMRCAKTGSFIGLRSRKNVCVCYGFPYPDIQAKPNCTVQ